MIKNLIIFRHGQYRDDAPSFGLISYGCEQISMLASFIETDVPLGKTVLLTSGADRAHQTAIIISEILGIDFKICRELRGPAGPFPTYEEFITLHEIVSTEAAEEDTETVILSTHAEYQTHYMKFFVKRMIGKEASTYSAKGSFIWFSLEHEKMIFLYVDQKVSEEKPRIEQEKCTLK